MHESYISLDPSAESLLHTNNASVMYRGRTAGTGDGIQ